MFLNRKCHSVSVKFCLALACKFTASMALADADTYMVKQCNPGYVFRVFRPGFQTWVLDLCV